MTMKTKYEHSCLEFVESLAAEGVDFGTTHRSDVLAILESYSPARVQEYFNALYAGKSAEARSFAAIVEVMDLDEELTGYLLTLMGPIQIGLQERFAQEAATFDELLALYADLGASERQAIAKKVRTKPQQLENWLRCLSRLQGLFLRRERLYGRSMPARPRLAPEHAAIDRARLFSQIVMMASLHDTLRPFASSSIRWELRRIVERHPGSNLAPLGFPDDWQDILGVPRRFPSEKPSSEAEPRPRGRWGGRPPKDVETIKQALFLYDRRIDSISEISRKTGVSITTIYKYLHLREQGDSAFE